MALLHEVDQGLGILLSCCSAIPHVALVVQDGWIPCPQSRQGGRGRAHPFLKLEGSTQKCSLNPVMWPHVAARESGKCSLCGHHMPS